MQNQNVQQIPPVVMCPPQQQEQRNQQMQNQNCQQMPAVVMYPQNGQQMPPAVMFPTQQQGIVYPPPMMQPATQQMSAQMIASNSEYPVSVQCPSCKEVMTTKVTKKMGSGVNCCLYILFFQLCHDKTKDRVHTCSKCKALVGIKEYKLLK